MPGKCNLWLINFNDSLWSAYFRKKSQLKQQQATHGLNLKNQMFLQIATEILTVHQNLCTVFPWHTARLHFQPLRPLGMAMRLSSPIQVGQKWCDSLTLAMFLQNFPRVFFCAPWLIWIVINLTEVSRLKKTWLRYQAKEDRASFWLNTWKRVITTTYGGKRLSVKLIVLVLFLKKLLISCYGRR